MSRNPINLANKIGFVIENFDKTNKRHLGICVCGVKGTVSYDSLFKEKFCRNDICKYFQQSKRLDEIEMKIIIEEKHCILISLSSKGVNGILSFICECGFKQQSSWLHFYREKFCKNYKCKHYHRQKEISDDIFKDWVEFEKFILCKKEGNSFYIQCERKHTFKSNYDLWRLEKRCKICNLENFYMKHNCNLLYNEETFPDNITINTVPYICSKGHIIKNLTKNCFNARINQNLDPCAICSVLKRSSNRYSDIYKELNNRNCFLVSKNKRDIIYMCSFCDKECKTQDNNIFRDTFTGLCLECTNPFNDPKIQEQIKNTIIEKYGVENIMHLPEIFSKVVKSSFTRKEFIFPKSKRKVYILGYEHLAIQYLLKYKEKILDRYIEEDEIQVDNISSFEYFDDNKKKHKYYPDIYILNTNLIIEVKSDFTFNKCPRINHLKCLAVVKSGYNMKLMIFNSKEKLIDIHYYLVSGRNYSLRNEFKKLDENIDIINLKDDIME